MTPFRLDALPPRPAPARPGRRPGLRRRPLPPERPHLAPLKPLASARTTQTLLPHGQQVLTIEHETLRGVTPPMLRRWFEELGGTITHEGVTWPRYLLWHPRDHIHWALVRPAPGGGSGPGARFRIVEAFGGDPRCFVDSVEEVEKLDDEGLTLVRRVLGVEIFRLEHRFGRVPGGASYRSRMVVGAGARAPFGRLFNRWVLPRLFTPAMGRAWLRHNVEEVGLFEALLPRLFGAPVAAP